MPDTDPAGPSDLCAVGLRRGAPHLRSASCRRRRAADPFTTTPWRFRAPVGALRVCFACGSGTESADVSQDACAWGGTRPHSNRGGEQGANGDVSQWWVGWPGDLAGAVAIVGSGPRAGDPSARCDHGVACRQRAQPGAAGESLRQWLRAAAQIAQLSSHGSVNCRPLENACCGISAGHLCQYP